MLVSGFPAHILPYVQQICPPELELVILPRGTPAAERRPWMEQARLFLGYAPADMVPHFEGYRFVQLISAGYDHLDLAAMRRFGVPVANNGGANAVGVAEHTIMLMLACLKHLCINDAVTRSGGWVAAGREPQEIEGRTVGLLGLGKIGQRVARRLQGWDVRVLYHDLFRQPAEVEAQLGLTYVDQATLLAESDLLSLHVPLTKENRHLINSTTIAQMKRGSILINTGRGPLVDEQALCEALQSGHLAGAGLDVYEVEPVTAANPLVKLDSVVLTPHYAGGTRQTWEKAAANGLNNLVRVLRGERPHYLIPELQDLAI